MEKVNINKAGSKSLQEIVHIGPARAAKIIQARTEIKFKDQFELSKVLGLGSKRMQDIINQGKIEV
jgi:DNA uptake protein ComE-like DNA-binding protein